MPAPSNVPSQLVERISPHRVQHYLEAAGWAQVKSKDPSIALYWRNNDRTSQVRVPLQTGFADYGEVLSSTLDMIARVLGAELEQIVEELLSPPSDLLFFGHAGPTVTYGNVALDQGIQLVECAKRLLLSAACSIAQPG